MVVRLGWIADEYNHEDKQLSLDVTVHQQSKKHMKQIAAVMRW